MGEEGRMGEREWGIGIGEGAWDRGVVGGDK